MGSYKPDGYTSVSPYLIVDGANATIEFLRHVFAAVEIRRFADPAGKIMHAEVRIDDTVVMIADGVEGWPPVPSHVHVYVPDVDATYRRALEAGRNIGAGAGEEGRCRQAWRGQGFRRHDMVDRHEDRLREAWLRGPIEGVPDSLQPVAHALIQAREEARDMLSEFPADLLWTRPAGVASVGFHLQHISGVVDRLFTYARGEPLTAEQRGALAREGTPPSAVLRTCSRRSMHRWIERSPSSGHAHRTP